MKSVIALLLLLNIFSAQAIEIGKAAPDFTLPGAVAGKDVSLSDFKGKIVVLEWLNHGCPFVRKHYDSGNMQALQKKFIGPKIVWLSIISSGKGQQGHVDGAGARADKEKNKSLATDILLDPKGTVGKAYGAKSTPHMFIINKKGILVYQGAIDDKPDTEQSSIPGARNFVSLALTDLLADQDVKVPVSKQYGCSVKYE